MGDSAVDLRLSAFGKFRSKYQESVFQLHPDWFTPFPVATDRIVFNRFTTDGQQAIWSMNPDGSDEKDLSKLPYGVQVRDGHPSLSSDRSKIVFTREEFPANSNAMYTMDSDGGSQAALSNPNGLLEGWEPCWSPDMTHIAYQDHYQIWVAEAGGTNPRALLDYSKQGNVIDHMPCWSHDGTEIAFCRESGGGGIIAAARADGSSAVPDMITLPTNWTLDGWPSWSKNNVIAFWRSDSFASQIWTVHSDGTGEMPVSHPDVAHGVADQAPCWSPDGTEIAFARTLWVEWRIWVMNPDGTNQRETSKISPFYSRYIGGTVDHLPAWA